jgi:hypothetical protein
MESMKPFLPNRVLIPKPIDKVGTSIPSVRMVTKAFLCLSEDVLRKYAAVTAKIVVMTLEIKE